jgi:hypothetical protein
LTQDVSRDQHGSRRANLLCPRLVAVAVLPQLGQLRGRDEATVRAMLWQHFAYAGSDPDVAHENVAHEMYYDDARLEFPQSGERFGVEHFPRRRRTNPAPTSFEIREIEAETISGSRRGSIKLRPGPLALRDQPPRVPRARDRA